MEYAGYGNQLGNIQISLSHPKIHGCTIRQGIDNGIYISRGNPDIRCNAITANAGGIKVHGNSNPVIFNNNIYGNASFGMTTSYAASTINAEENYWGDPSGPSGIGPGTGDAVTGDVDFDPFLTFRAPCDFPLFASFTANPVSGCEILSVNFTDHSTGVVNAWEWDFDDGTGSTEQHPEHDFKIPGEYTVALTVYEGTDSDTATRKIFIGESVPTADFSGTPMLGPWPLGVDFTDASHSCGTDAIVSWEWDFESDGIVDAAVPNPSHTFTRSGSYNVTLKVEDNDGNTDIIKKVGYILVSCPGDLDQDNDCDGLDLAAFASEFNRVDCHQAPLCKADFDGDKDVDTDDLDVFAADFGSTDCPN